MDEQDWIHITVRRQHTKKELIQKGGTTIQQRDTQQSERMRIAKLESPDAVPVKKKISGETLQELIRKRIEMKLNQEKADILCSFPRNTFKEIESNRLIPSEDQKRRILQNFGIQLKTITINPA